MTATSITYCSHNSRDVSLEAPLGSAPAFSRSFLIEVPLPWSRVPLETTHIPQEVSDAITGFQAAKGKVSVYLLASDASYPVAGARLIDMQVIDGRITRREIISPSGDLAGVIHSLTTDAPSPNGTIVDDTPWRDIAVCTHGSRDACCASFGFPMYLKMHAAAKSLPHTRVWRCSHLGGHRFAPTMIDFSSGRSWGLVDEPAAQAILLEHTEPASIIRHYRGWVGHKDAELQMLEAEAFASIGWSWNEWQQSGRVLERDTEGRGVVVQLTASHPDHDDIAFHAEIEWGDSFTTIASCNAEPVQYIRKKLVNMRTVTPVGSGSS